MQIGDYCFVSNQDNPCDNVAGVISFLTEKALLVETDKENLWIPLSQVQDWDLDRISLVRTEWHLWVPGWLMKGGTDALEQKSQVYSEEIGTGTAN
jgi:hypothetical protein